MRRNNKNLRNEFFDEYQRYQIVADAVEFYRKSSSDIKYHILEIGANKSKHLSKFLPEDNILYTDIILDSEMQQDPEFMEVDGTAMPFEDKSYDFVVATDVLEHIPCEKRNKLLEEAARVAKHAAIITFPYNSYENNAAETRINAYYKALKGEDYIWIQEHKKYGLPELEDVENILSNIECDYFHFLCGDIVLWEKLYYSFFSALDHCKEWEFRKQIDHLYFDVLYDGDWSNSCYRAVYIITREKNEKLRHYLQNKKMRLSSKQLNILEMLLNAQNTIHVKEDNDILERELKEKTEKIEYLENANFSMGENWKRDVKHWETDNAKHASIISQLTLEKKHLQDMLDKSQNYIDKIHSDIKLKESQNIEFLSQIKSLQMDLKKYMEKEILLEQELMNLQQGINVERQQKLEFYKQLERAKSIASEMQETNVKLTKQLEFAEKQYDTISQAFFWKISKPIRVILDYCKSLIRK